MALLCVAFAATVFGLNERNDALQRELAAKKVETEALFKEQAANQKAAQRYEDLKTAIDRYFVTVIDNKELASTPGAEAIREELLSVALSYYESWVSENQDDQELLRRCKGGIQNRVNPSRDTKIRSVSGPRARSHFHA